ncbi:MAG TPA: serine/threonine protein kinase [Pyrinomonadaceae bacterium]|jgi:serine/threonine protein kinase
MKELAITNCRLDGRYDVQSLLGRGSYAEIYVAKDALASPQSPHSLVVIKALNVFMQNDLDTDLERTLVENFQNEAIALDRVRHPNIISRLGHGSARDLHNTIFHYLVLEYLSGGDLAKMCREGGMSLAQALYYLEQVCAGLAHAHAHGVIHRDIKPQNLLLTADKKTVKIADFGVARLNQSDSPITRVGTNIYAPPEHSPMMSGNTGTLTFSELTPAADIYSLAKSAYVLITCDSPRAFSNQPITSLPEKFRREPWAGRFLEIIKKATQSDSRERHQSVNDFWQELSELKLLAEDEEEPAEESATEVSKRNLNPTPQAHVAKGYTPLAPQKPLFNTSRDLRINPNLSAKENVNLVIELGNGHAPKFPAMQTKAEEKESLPILREYVSEERKKPRRRFFVRFATFLIVIAAFAAVLFVTYNYLQKRRGLTEISNPFAKPTGAATSDVNLRQDANADSQKIGLVPKSSRVRVVNSKDNWYEIDIIEYGRPKETPTDAEHGWVNKKYIDLD